MARLKNSLVSNEPRDTVLRTKGGVVAATTLSDQAPILLSRILDFCKKYHDCADDTRRKEVHAYQLKLLDKMIPKKVEVDHNHMGTVDTGFADMLIRLANGQITHGQAIEIESQIMENDE
jgi:hypothetical protein